MVNNINVNNINVMGRILKHTKCYSVIPMVHILSNTPDISDASDLWISTGMLYELSFCVAHNGNKLGNFWGTHYIWRLKQLNAFKVGFGLLYGNILLSNNIDYCFNYNIPYYNNPLSIFICKIL